MTKDRYTAIALEQVSARSTLLMHPDETASGTARAAALGYLDEGILQHLSQYDSDPFIIEMPLMRLNSSMREKRRGLTIDGAMLDMVASEINAKHVPAFIGHDWLWSKDTPAGRWLGADRRDDWIYGALYLGKSDNGLAARQIVREAAVAAAKIGSSIVVGGNMFDEEGNIIPWSDGPLLSVDLTPVEGTAVIADSEKRPDITYLSVTMREARMNVETAANAATEAAQAVETTALAGLEAQLAKANAAIEAQAAELKKLRGRQLSLDITDMVKEFAAECPEMVGILTLFVMAAGKPLVDSIGEARGLLEQVMGSTEFQALAELAARKPAETYGPPVPHLSLRRDLPAEAAKASAADKGSERFADEAEKEKFIASEQERAGMHRAAARRRRTQVG